MFSAVFGKPGRDGVFGRKDQGNLDVHHICAGRTRRKQIAERGEKRISVVVAEEGERSKAVPACPCNGLTVNERAGRIGRAVYPVSAGAEQCPPRFLLQGERRGQGEFLIPPALPVSGDAHRRFPAGQHTLRLTRGAEHSSQRYAKILSRLRGIPG